MLDWNCIGGLTLIALGLIFVIGAPFIFGRVHESRLYDSTTPNDQVR